MSDQSLEKYNLRRYKGESSDDQEINWIFDHSVANAPETDVDAAWNNLQAKIHSPVIKKTSWSKKVLRIAASVAILAVAFFATKDNWTSSPLTQVVANQSGHEVTFPDGSISILNEQAIVGYPEAFGDTRTVEFEGEAYFDIIKDEAKPFVIKMNDIDVRVLGTAFNLNSSKDKIEVLVERGLVAFEKGDQQVLVSKGELGSFNKSTMEILVDTTPPTNLMSWRNGKFHFEDVSAEDVTTQLSEFYKVDFVLSESMKTCRVTAQFDNATLEEVIKVLETVLNASISKGKSAIKIKGKGC